MRRFGWTRLACLFLILTVLAALVRLGGGAEARSLATRVPDALVVASAKPEPTVARLTEAQSSALEDMSGEPAPKASPPPAESSPTRPAAGAAQRSVEAPARTVPAEGPPTFYRPSSSPRAVDQGPVCGDVRGTPAGARVVFPLERQYFYSYDDTWGAPRTQGGHEGTDLMTPTSVPEFAVTDGTVVPVAGSDANGWNTLGGNAVMVRADYSIGPVKAGDLFYYAHLRTRSPLEIGDRVAAGQVVGYSGDTGQGPPGTSGLFPTHLHLGWYDGTGGRQQATSGAMNPYPLLEWIKANGGAVSGGSDARFCEAPQTGPPTPASGGAWPTPSNPGRNPDLDTGNPGQDSANENEAQAAKPASPDRPGKNPATRPTKPPPPDRPDKEPQRPARPQNDPAKPTPAQNPSGGGQYDPATGESAAPAQAPSPKQKAEPKVHKKPDQDKEPASKKNRPQAGRGNR